MNKLICAISIACLLFPFQNCIETSIQFSTASLESNQVESGNGLGYGGKLSYYHYVPGYNCEDQPSAFAEISYNPNASSSEYKRSRASRCLSVTSTVNNNQLDLGSLQNKVIGYAEGIFEENPAGPNVIPANPVEIWCVDQWGTSDIEILSTYNEAGKIAQTEFYYPGQTTLTEQNPARSTSLQSVQLISNYFKLVVDKSRRGLKPGTFEGQLTLNENRITQTLQCRLGGYLDARLWPARALNFDNFIQAEWNESERKLYYASGLRGFAGWAENILFSYAADLDLNQTLLGDVQNAYGVSGFQFTPDRSQIILNAHLSGTAASQLYSLNPISPLAPSLLSNFLTLPNQAVTGDFLVGPTGEYVYYLDSSQEDSTDVEPWLRAVNLSTKNIIQINHDLSLGGDKYVGQYEVSYSLSKIIYTASNTMQDVWITDLIGSNIRQLNLSATLDTSYFISGVSKNVGRWLMVDDRYIFLAAQKKLSAAAMLLVIDLENEKVIFNKQFDTWIVIQSVPGLPAVRLSVANSYFNLETNQIEPLATLISHFKKSPLLSVQQAARTLDMSTTEDACTNSEPLAKVIPLKANLWLVLKRLNASILSAYLTDGASTSCTLINKIIVTPENNNALLDTTNNLIKARISSDHKQIALALAGHLYLVPADQRPVIEIYTSLNTVSRIDELGFFDNKKIFFGGPLIENNLSQLFIWSLPHQ